MTGLDLDAIEARANAGVRQTTADADVLALVARVRELEAREKRVREVVKWVEDVATEMSSVADDQVGQSIVDAYRAITTQIRAELSDPS